MPTPTSTPLNTPSLSTLLPEIVSAISGELFVATGIDAGSEVVWASREPEADALAPVRAGDRLPADLFGIEPSHRQVLEGHFERDGRVDGLAVAFLTPGQAVRWARVSVSPLSPAGGHPNVLVHIADLRDNIALAERTGDPAHLAGSLDALLEQKSRLISVFSHDLRNPLTVILGNAQLIEVDECSDMVRESAEDIHAAAQRMREIIDTLVLTRRLEDPLLAVEPTLCNPADIAEARVGQISAAAKAKEIGFQFLGGSHTATADLPLIEVVLDAFLSNAVKFCSPGSTIEVTTAPSTHGVRVSVRDNGPGLAPEEVKLLFRKFTKLTPQPTQDEGGLGLGLYLAERAARAMNAKVGAESQGVGQGCRFFVDIPA